MSRKLPETVRVTDDHISRGLPESETRCAIALASTEQASIDRLEVEVSGGQVWAWVKGTGAGSLADLPDEADAFVEAFDNGGDVRPFEFAISWRKELT